MSSLLFLSTMAVAASDVTAIVNKSIDGCELYESEKECGLHETSCVWRKSKAHFGSFRCKWRRTAAIDYRKHPMTHFQDYDSILRTGAPGSIVGEHDLCANNICSNGLRVYTDKDDTTVCSGGWRRSGPAGIHEQCIPGAVYPGVAAFFRGLGNSRATDGAGETKFMEISARPTWGSSGDRRVSKKEDVFSGAELDNQLSRIGYGGSKGEGALAAMSGDWISVGETKVQNFMMAEEEAMKDKSHMPGAAVWVGDDGQGDAYAGRAFQKDVRASFIHRVQPHPFDGSKTSKILTSRSSKILTSLMTDSSGLVYFYTYPEAAQLAYTLKLLSREAYVEVLSATIDSALGHACCNEKACDGNSVKNLEDGTCGGGSSTTLSYYGRGTATDPCRDIRDAVRYADEEGVDYTCKGALIAITVPDSPAKSSSVLKQRTTQSFLAADNWE